MRALLTVFLAVVQLTAGDDMEAVRARESEARDRYLFGIETGVDVEKIARNMRRAVAGGSALPVEILKQFKEKFGVQILEGYGLSETSPVASFNHPDRERKPGSIGTPIEGVEMKVVDDDGNEVAQGEPGEIVVRGDGVVALQGTAVCYTMPLP